MAEEMKNSDSEWMGDIPSSWNVDKIGVLYNQRNTKVSDTEYAPLSVTMKGILPQLDTAAKSDDSDNRKLVCKGDFVINSRSDRRGSCGISEMDGSVSLINTVLTPKASMTPKFYNWLFHTSQFADEFYKWGHGIVDDLWTTRWQDMKHISVPVPSMKEQKIIARYLNNECTTIDSMISDARTNIEDYKLLKQSIITQAVTKGLDPNVEMKESGVEWIGKVPITFELKRMQDIAKYKKGPFGSSVKLSMFVEDAEDTYKVYEQKNAIYKNADGVEILVHCGVDTVEAKGDGFTLFDKKQGDSVKAGEPIITVDLNKLKARYDMSTMLIITESNGQTFQFKGPGAIARGDSLTADLH